MKVIVQKYNKNILPKVIETFEEFQILFKEKYNKPIDIFSLDKSEILKIVQQINECVVGEVILSYLVWNKNVDLIFDKLNFIEFKNLKTNLDEEKSLIEIFKEIKNDETKIDYYINYLLLNYKMNKKELKVLKGFKDGKISNNQFINFLLINKLGKEDE